MDGKKVELVIFDDQNDPYLARQEALEIHEHAKILMVIGHDTSESSFRGGDIYRVAGIALNVERPFRVGDWVKIGEQEGQVVDMTWRTTRNRPYTRL